MAPDLDEIFVLGRLVKAEQWTAFHWTGIQSRLAKQPILRRGPGRLTNRRHGLCRMQEFYCDRAFRLAEDKAGLDPPDTCDHQRPARKNAMTILYWTHVHIEYLNTSFA